MSASAKHSKTSTKSVSKKNSNIDLNPPKKNRISYEKQLPLEDFTAENHKKLLQYIEHKAKENKLAYLTLGAQDQAQGFYLSLGYHVVGAGFLDAGINHHRMDKKI